jgi:hypothetical protein
MTAAIIGLVLIVIFVLLIAAAALLGMLVEPGRGE